MDNDQKKIVKHSLPMDMTDRLTAILKHKKWKKKDLAAAAGVQQRTVSRWITQGVEPSEKALRNISDKSGISYLFLKEGKGPLKQSAVWAYKARLRIENSPLLEDQIYERIEEIIAAKGWNKEKLAAIADLTGDICPEKTRWINCGHEPISPWNIDKIASAAGYDRDWLLTGFGKRLKEKEYENKVAAKIEPGEKQHTTNHGQPTSSVNLLQDSSQDDIVDEHGENISTDKLMLMTGDILESQTVYRSALASNIRAFHQAVKGEEEMGDLRRQMEAMAKDMAEMKEMMRTLSSPVQPKKKQAGNLD